MTSRGKKWGRVVERASGSRVESLEGRWLFSGSPQLSVATSAVNNAVAFNTVAQGYGGAAPSRIETATVTDTGTAPLTFASGAFGIVDDPSASPAASDFAITNAASLPSSLSPGQSFTIDLQYTATQVGLQSALLRIQSNDPANPTFDVNLHGIGTTGQFGTQEPSLVQVLRAHNIPTVVGAGPNDANINTQAYPINPDPSSQEVPMQRLVVATAGEPVTITPLASFSAATPAVSRIGYYAPGNPGAPGELFYVGQADAQTVDPAALGATSFNPGSAPFALYGEFPGTTTPSGRLDVHYSEDALNTASTDGTRKIRFFPMETAAGATVPNSYVFAVEDYDSSTYNSFINFVGIIGNVRPASNASSGSVPSNPAANNPPVMGVNLNQVSPGSTNLVFNDLSVPNAIQPDVVHDTQSITVNNTGDQPLVISGLTLSDPNNWTLVNPPAPGTSIAAGSSLNVTIRFIASSNPPHTGNQTNDTHSFSGVPNAQAGGVWTGTLTLNSNDPVNPTQTVNLAGYWQYASEHENEPNVHTLTNLLLGYNINDVGSASTQGTEFPNNGNTPVLYGSEVDPSNSQGLLVAADPSQPVSLTEVAAFHSEYATPKAYVITNGAAQEVDLTSISESGSTVTVNTYPAETFQAGQRVTIQGVNPNGYDGTFTISSAPNSTTFTYTATAGLGATMPLPAQGQSGWYPAGASTQWLYKDAPDNGQSLYPNLLPGSFGTVRTTFNPTGAFGINLDGQVSQDSLNSGNLQYGSSEHALRFFPVVGADGNAVPNTWIVGLDYRNYVGPNSDYQDLFMLLSNATFAAMPPTPIDFQASRVPSGVQLQWTPMAGATGYNVLASVNGGSFTQVNGAPIAGSSFVDTAEPNGAAVQYEVVSVGAGGAVSLPADASINLGSSVTAPAAPAFQQADGSSGTKVVLSWSAPAGATAYNLLRAAGQGGFVTLASGLIGTTYVDPGVAAGSTYQYEVQATNAGGASPFSLPVGVTVASNLTAPAAPTITSADASSGTQVVLIWTASAGASTYQVQREGPGQQSYATIATGLTTPTFTDTGVSPGTAYSYRIVAANDAGSSAPGSPVTATLPAAQSELSLTVGGGALSYLRFATAQGTSVLVRTRGPGSITVHLSGRDLSGSPIGKGVLVTGSNIAIAEIDTNATSGGSSFLIATTGGNKSVNVGAIRSGSALNAIIAPTASLIGPLTVAGSVNRVVLGSAVASTMTIDGSLSSFRAASVNGASLTVGGTIGDLSADHWTSNQEVRAASVFAVRIAGDAQFDLTTGSLRSMRVRGNLHDSVVSLGAAGALDLGRLSAAGIERSRIETAGDIGTVAAAMLVDSQIRAGVGPGAGAAFPPVGGSFAANSTIASVSLKPVRGGFSYEGSTIAASRVKNLALGKIRFDNAGTPFGVQSLSIGRLGGTTPTGRPFGFRNLTNPAAAASDFSALKIDPQDFAIAFPSQYSGS